MSDLISREVARRIISSDRSKEQMLAVLDSVPSAEQKGRWVINPNDIDEGFQRAGRMWIRCNKCNNQNQIDLCSPLYDFCPWCGADMRRSV